MIIVALVRRPTKVEFGKLVHFFLTVPFVGRHSVSYNFYATAETWILTRYLVFSVYFTQKRSSCSEDPSETVFEKTDIFVERIMIHFAFKCLGTKLVFSQKRLQLEQLNTRTFLVEDLHGYKFSIIIDRYLFSGVEIKGE